MEFTELFNLITPENFAMVLVIFLLLRYETAIKKVGEAMQKNTEAMQEMKEVMSGFKQVLLIMQPQLNVLHDDDDEELGGAA